MDSERNTVKDIRPSGNGKNIGNILGQAVSEISRNEGISVATLLLDKRQATDRYNRRLK